MSLASPGPSDDQVAISLTEPSLFKVEKTPVGLGNSFPLGSKAPKSNENNNNSEKTQLVQLGSGRF